MDTHDHPDLDHVASAIHDAKVAEDHLRDIAPGSLLGDDETDIESTTPEPETGESETTEPYASEPPASSAPSSP